MTDYEMLSIVIMIITLVVSLLINNRDKKKQRRHPALTGGRLNSLKGGEKPTTASSLPAVIISDFIAFAKGKNFANIFSLVLRAFQLGRSFGSRKKHKK